MVEKALEEEIVIVFSAVLPDVYAIIENNLIGAHNNLPNHKTHREFAAFGALGPPQ
jgi:hypothetical protein